MTTDSNSPNSLNPEPDLSGRQLGDYLLLHRLGRGGMAEVYLANQESLRRQVAFKVLKRELAGDQSYVRRFHHEAQAAAALVQANIVQIYEVGNIEGTHFIAQEYVKGHNLKQFLTRHGSVDLFLAISIMRQVASALLKAGEHGVIHRDIKPENIMLSPEGEVKVADFGLARIKNERQQTELTQVGITMGTPLYMSPEQVEGEAVDPRSDIYSFGITCYHMLAGRPPFEGETALAVAVQHLKKEAVPLQEFRPDLPQELCDIIHRMMAKAPEDRFASAADLLRELRGLDINENDETWAATLERLGATEAQSLANTRVEATQHLHDVMKARQSGSGRNVVPRIIAGVTAMLLCLLTGVLYSMLSPPTDLLEISPDELIQVPQQESVLEQYRYAFKFDKERFWKAVGEYYPPQGGAGEKKARYYGRLADARLGELYLREQDWDAAEKIYLRLSEVEETEVRFRIFGLVGLTVVYYRQWDADRDGQSQKKSMALQQLEKIVEIVGPTNDNQTSGVWRHLNQTTLKDEFGDIFSSLTDLAADE